MKKRCNFDFKCIIWTVVITAISLLMLIFPSKSITAAQNAVLTCLNTLVPSLFPFMVITVFLTQSGLSRYIFLIPSKIISRITGLDRFYCDLFFIGMIGGYPSGAKNIGLCVENGQIDVGTAEILLCFCTNAGPSFLISAVGCKMFLSSDIGFILYLSSLLSSFSLLMFYSNKIKSIPKRLPKSKKIDFGENLIKSVKTSCESMVMISALVVLFSVLLGYINTLWSSPSIIKAITFGVFEVTLANEAASYKLSLLNIIASSIVSSFGGLCVAFQIKSICTKANISIKKYLFSRFLNILLNIVFTFLLLLTIPIRTQQTFASNVTSASAGLFSTPVSSIMLLICCLSFPFSLTTRKKL